MTATAFASSFGIGFFGSLGCVTAHLVYDSRRSYRFIRYDLMPAYRLLGLALGLLACAAIASGYQVRAWFDWLVSHNSGESLEVNSPQSAAIAASTSASHRDNTPTGVRRSTASTSTADPTPTPAITTCWDGLELWTRRELLSLAKVGGLAGYSRMKTDALRLALQHHYSAASQRDAVAEVLTQ